MGGGEGLSPSVLISLKRSFYPQHEKRSDYGEDDGQIKGRLEGLGYIPYASRDKVRRDGAQAVEYSPCPDHRSYHLFFEVISPTCPVHRPGNPEEHAQDSDAGIEPKKGFSRSNDP